MKSLQQLTKNISWMMVSEVLSRLSRFVTLFVLAISFTDVDYGTAMLAVVCHDLFRVLTRLGVGAKIIQCAEKSLNEICVNARLLQWGINILVAIVQCLLAQSISVFYDNPSLVLLIQVMAISHLIYPLVTVKVFVLQRKNKMRYFGIASGSCIAFENLLVALLVYLSSDVMMVAYAKVAAAIFWVVLFARAESITLNADIKWSVIQDLLKYSSKLLGCEILKALRWQADSLFAARLLSPEMFGLYSFARSASVGIGQTVSNAYLSGVFPYLCSQRRNGAWKTGYKLSIIATCVIASGFIIQALLAPWYIELLFDTRWEHAIPIAAILCLVAIPTLFADYFSVLLRANDQAGREVQYTALCTATLAGMLYLIAPTTIESIIELTLYAGLVWFLSGIYFVRLKSNTSLVPTGNAMKEA